MINLKYAPGVNRTINGTGIPQIVEFTIYFNFFRKSCQLDMNKDRTGIFGGVFMTNEIEKAYWTHETAKYLDIGESTLRKWCIELEKNGYTFVKGAMDSRAFTDNDLTALTYFKQLYKVKKHTKEQAAKAVIEKFSNEGVNERTTPVPMENDRSYENLEKMVKNLLEHTKKQEEFNKALLKRLDNQERYIKESLENRDKLLLETIRESQEEKAAALEKKKRPWYKRFLNG